MFNQWLFNKDRKQKKRYDHDEIEKFIKETDESIIYHELRMKKQEQEMNNLLNRMFDPKVQEERRKNIEEFSKWLGEQSKFLY